MSEAPGKLVPYVRAAMGLMLLVFAAAAGWDLANQPNPPLGLLIIGMACFAGGMPLFIRQLRGLRRTPDGQHDEDGADGDGVNGQSAR